MNSRGRVHSILETLKAAYGSLQEPNYAFAPKRYAALRCHPLVGDVMSRYFVKDDTDLNDHVSMHLRVLHAHGSLMLCLSFVDKWTMLFRLEAENPVYTEVIERASHDLLPAEREIMGLLRKHGFRLVTKSEAATPVQMKLFNTDRQEARLYHTIVADDGVVPLVLLR